MFRGSTVSTLIGACAAILGLAGAAGQRAEAAEPSGSEAAQDWARNNPPSPVQAQAQPVPKDNMHPKVVPEEREAIGLPAPVWTTEDKVHPAVSAALEEQRRLMREGPEMAWVQFDRPAGFEGTAYVDVYLRHKARGEFDSADNHAAVQEVQKRLLSSLTAAQFSLVFAFKNTAGLVGYVNEAGLAKLGNDPDVMAVGLDDQPRPEDPPIVRHEPTPRRKPGDKFTPTPRVERIGKVEAPIYTALEKSADGYLFVIVNLDRPVPNEAPYEQKTLVARQVQDRVLAALTADEFRLKSRMAANGLDGYVNAAGLAKLDKHPDVIGVGLSGEFERLGVIKKAPRNR